MPDGSTRNRRPLVSGLLVLLCALLASAGVTARWAHSTATDTDTWTEATEPIFGDGDIISSIAGHLADRALDTVDISAFGDDLLPSALEFLGDGAETAARFTLVEIITGTLRQPGVTQLLSFANREAHELIVPVLLDEHEYVHIDGDDVVVDLDPVLADVTERLQGIGLPVWEDGPPEDTARFVLVTSPRVGEAKSGLDTLGTFAWLLPFLSLLCGAGAIALARDRARVVMVTGLAIAVVALASLGAQAALGVSLVSRWTDPIDELLGREIWDLASAGLVTHLLALGAAGMVVTVAISVGATALDARRGAGAV